ncbi:hypothetical protein FV217_22500, partial [Methylobacterium sp. WL9]
MSEDGACSPRIAPTHPLILRCEAQPSLEGGLQRAARSLEPSFEASASLRHLRMRWVGGRHARRALRPAELPRQRLRIPAEAA